MSDKPNDGCNPETLSEHLAFREKMAQASRDCIRRNEEDMKRERDNELASLRAEVERLKAENSALREGWEASFKEGWYEGVNVPLRNWGMTVDGNVDSDWSFSTSKQRLDEIGKGEG